MFYLALLKKEHNISIGLRNNNLIQEIDSQTWKGLIIHRSNQAIDKTEFVFIFD